MRLSGNVDTYYFISYILQHISTLANHHHGDYNFKESEASKSYNCTGPYGGRYSQVRFKVPCLKFVYVYN